ncbi:MAG TPA: hypothetical protein VHF07_00800 [Nitrospiraceae bacterium]|nr:hypothetical protein [Nitrospiraceae bacterium]
MNEPRTVHRAETRLIVGLLPDLESTKQVLRELRAQGIGDDDIGLAMRQSDEAGLPPGEMQAPATEDAAKGAVGGGIIGGFAGLLAATGVVVVPGLAPLLAGGTLASALGMTGATVAAGAGVGATAGGLVGGLVSINVPETAARRYDEAVRRGRVLITVKTDRDPAWIQALLERHGGETGVGS